MNVRRVAPSSTLGFTLVELLTVIAIAMVLMLFSYPALHHMMQRSKLLGAAQELSAITRMARLEAIKHGVTTIVQVDLNAGTAIAFADINGNFIFDVPPASTEIRRDIDYQIATYTLPSGVYFWGAPDASPKGAAAIFGLTPDPAGKLPNMAVFNPDGSIQATGAFRIASGDFPRSGGASTDTQRNFLQLMIAPQATARIRVEKFNPTVTTTDPTQYFEPGNDPSTGQPLWVWYY